MADDLLTADQIQDPDDPARIAAARAEEEIKQRNQEALAAVIAAAVAAAGLILLGTASQRQARIAALLDTLKSELRPALETIQTKADEMAAAVAENIEGGFAYDPAGIGANALVEAYQAEIVSQMSDGLGSTIDLLTANATANGLSESAFATLLRDAVALAPAQAQAIINYRSLLEVGDLGALQRLLRDRRFDPTVQRSINGLDLSSEQIDRMVQRYAERFQAFRVSNLAGDQAMAAATLGTRSAWRQAIARGIVSASEVRRFWLTARNERVCRICRSIPILNPNGVGIDGSYRSIAGDVDAPEAHPNCQCTERYEIMDLSLNAPRMISR